MELSKDFRELLNQIMPNQVNKAMEELETNLKDEKKLKENLHLIIEETDSVLIPELAEQLMRLEMGTEILEHFEDFIDKCAPACLFLFIKQIKTIPGVEKKIEEHYITLTRKAPEYEMVSLIKQLNKMEIIKEKLREDVDYFIQYTFDRDIPRLAREYQSILTPEELSRHIEDLIECCNSTTIVNLIEELNKQEETRQELEKYEQQIKAKVIEGCAQASSTALTKERLEQEKIYDFVEITFNEILKNEEESILNIKDKGRGQHAKGYQIGEKVIKFGEGRCTEIIPYHRRILQPILRRPVYNLAGTSSLFYVEIQEAVENWEEAEITDEDVYQAYRELREDGILWVDAKAENLGKLKKPNTVHMKNFNQVEDSTVGIDREDGQKREILQAGELVVLDSDFIYRIEDLDQDELKDMTSSYACEIHEKRYQEEKRQEEKRRKKMLQGEER